MTRANIAGAVALTGYLALIFLLLLWNGWLAPPEALPRALVILLLVGPLMFPLRGMLHGRPYTYAWSSYLALLYFVLGVGEAWVNPAERGLALLEVLFSVLMFTGAILYARWRGMELNRSEESCE